MNIKKLLYQISVVLEVDVNESDGGGINGDGGGVTALSSSVINLIVSSDSVLVRYGDPIFCEIKQWLVYWYIDYICYAYIMFFEKKIRENQITHV